MPLQLCDGAAVISGTVTVEEVESLAAWLRQAVAPRIDLTDCAHLHTGALQAFLRFGARICGAPADPFLRDHVLPLLDADLPPAEAGPVPLEPLETS